MCESIFGCARMPWPDCQCVRVQRATWAADRTSQRAFATMVYQQCRVARAASPCQDVKGLATGPGAAACMQIDFVTEHISVSTLGGRMRCAHPRYTLREAPAGQLSFWQTRSRWVSAQGILRGLCPSIPWLQCPIHGQQLLARTAQRAARPHEYARTSTCYDKNASTGMPRN